MPTLADQTRDAARETPFLVAALRAGVVNYAAAARFLDVDGDPDAVATALRRFAEELPAYGVESRDVRVTMERGLGPADGEAALLRVGGVGLAPDAGSLVGILAEGDVDAAALAGVLSRLSAGAVGVEAAGVAGDALLIVVGRRDGATALRRVESALDAVPVWERD